MQSINIALDFVKNKNKNLRMFNDTITQNTPLKTPSKVKQSRPASGNAKGLSKTTPAKAQQSMAETRTKHNLDRQVSMQVRMEKARTVFEDDADQRDLSPSQRERFIDEEVKAYQKPEMIRQAIKMVKTGADAQK